MVFLVGAGPGDAELLTLKAARLLGEAEVVVYDRLVGPGILAMANPAAELIYVGKERARHFMRQTEINALLVRRGQLGQRVVRLKGGDPLIFGRGGEEVEALLEAGVPFEIVPGVTAAAGCAAAAVIPLTHRDHAKALIFVTGHTKDGEPGSTGRLCASPARPWCSTWATRRWIACARGWSSTGCRPPCRRPWSRTAPCPSSARCARRWAPWRPLWAAWSCAGRHS